MARNQSDQWGVTTGTPTGQANDSSGVFGFIIGAWTMLGVAFFLVFLLAMISSSISPCNPISRQLNPTGLLGYCNETDEPKLN